MVEVVFSNFWIF